MEYRQTNCIAVSPRLLPGSHGAPRSTGTTDNHQQKGRSPALTSLPRPPPVPFNAVFLLSFGNHIVWDCFLWEQEGVVEGGAKRQGLPFLSWSQFHFVLFPKWGFHSHHCWGIWEPALHSIFSGMFPGRPNYYINIVSKDQNKYHTHTQDGEQHHG